MSSNYLDLTVRQGEDFYRLLTIQDQNGNDINLTGYTFTAQIRETYSSPLFMSFSFTILDQDTNTGEVEMEISAATSSAKVINSELVYKYDVEMNDGTSTTRIMEGNCIISPEVTR